MLIGVIGKARVGKDTFAGMLAEELYNRTKRRFILMAYAHELKLRIQKDFDLSYDQLWGDTKEVSDGRYFNKSTNTNWTPREMLQAYGEFFRSIEYDFWVNNLFRVVDQKDYKDVIITDVRHVNEAHPIKERDGILIKVVCNRDDKQEVHGSNHISETALDNYQDVDFTVVNDWGLAELKQSTIDVVKFILEYEKLKKDLEV